MILQGKHFPNETCLFCLCLTSAVSPPPHHPSCFKWTKHIFHFTSWPPVFGRRSKQTEFILNKIVFFLTVTDILALLVLSPQHSDDRVSFLLHAVSAKPMPLVSVSGCDSNWLRRHSGQYLIRLTWPLLRSESIAKKKKEQNLLAQTHRLSCFSQRLRRVSRLIATAQLSKRLGRTWAHSGCR